MPYPSTSTYPSSTLFPGGGVPPPPLPPPPPPPPPGSPPEPTATELGRMLYSALRPLAVEDYRFGWALLLYCDALMAQAQPLRDQIKEVGDRPGYGVLMDPDTCPADALEYLSQLAGVDISKVRKGSKLLGRNECLNPSFEYDTAPTKPVEWRKQFSEGTITQIYTTSEGWAYAGAKSMHIQGSNSSATERKTIGLEQILGTSAIHGSFFTVQARLNIIQAASKGFLIKVDWYKADGTTLLSSTEVKEQLSGLTGVQTLAAEFSPPEKSALAKVSFLAQFPVTEQKIEFYIDGIMFTNQATKPAELPIKPYIDGDQPECNWVGLPGQSASVRVLPETEEEFSSKIRNYINELPNSERGTVGALVKALQEQLSGTKTVIVRERPEGNAWRIKIATFKSETLSERAAKEAIEEQLPAGIVLEYQVVNGATYFLISVEYTTYKEVKEAFKTYGGLALNQPGT